ncbi:cation efflux protein [Macrolepiota fuliginosa MF-IS2]|uniref:Cation efflux protein n=1 Tax=Macrolepiota fuliginosa MF-IS2 TaxID=1400762 RepID=A0A9P6CA25_9AGAR|nr:cation efflux protein [Macrolepiota fuliginosa MF-IS2]
MAMSRSARITFLLLLDILFFFVELIVGYAVGSLALIADSFHMLNDVMSLIVALYAIKLTTSTERDSRYSYGWHRAEILAALVNGVFLLALCFSISLEALERFFETPEISNPRLVVVVGSLGLASNIVGLFLFHEHGHSHGQSEDPTTRASLVLTAQEIAQARSMSRTDPISNEILPPSNDETTPLLQEHTDPAPALSRGHSHGSSMNMRALVLHVLGDALGNVGVIATGLIIWKTSWSFKYYFDPIISLVITLIIFSSALPLVRSASFILLQGVPSTVSLDEIKKSILAEHGVISLHELHVWQLSETKIVASVHVLAERRYDFMHIAANIRGTLHRLGIHSSTIQPEYIQTDNPDSKRTNGSSCLITCPPDQACDPSQHACCPPPSDDV